MKNKENALHDFMTMIKRSWTYNKMTEEEKSRCMIALQDVADTGNALTGTYEHRYYVLHAVYSAYLLGLGYKPDGWRE